MLVVAVSDANRLDCPRGEAACIDHQRQTVANVVVDERRGSVDLDLVWMSKSPRSRRPAMDEPPDGDRSSDRSKPDSEKISSVKAMVMMANGLDVTEASERERSSGAASPA